jgi:lipopolysaccharide export system permease protein
VKLLQRHLFWSVSSTCLAAVGLFAFVLLLGNLLRDLLGPMLSGQIPIDTSFQLIVLLVPYVAPFALPMGILTGVLLVLGRMSAQHEITAMRAAGMGLSFIARPILLLGLLGAAVTLAVNFYYMPRARTAYKQIFSEAVQRNPLSFIVPQTFIREFPGVVVFVGRKEGPQLLDFWVWRVDDQARVRMFARADEGYFDYNPETNTLVLTLRRVVVETRNEEDPENFSQPPATSAVEELPVQLQLDHLFRQQVMTPKLAWLTFDELVAEWRRLSAPEQALDRLRVSFALNEKASAGVAVLAFAFLAMPLGIKVSRKETSANLGVALLLVMGYYFSTVVISWLDQYPALRPDLLLWLPAIGFFAMGGWLVHRFGKT